MSVEILNRETVKSIRTKPPTIQIFERGQIRFSIEAAKILNIVKGDKIELAISAMDKGIIYFGKDCKGFELKEEKTKSGASRLLLCCRPLAKKIMNHFGLTGSKTYDITGEVADFYGKKYWFILKNKVHVPLKWKTLKAA